MIFLQFLKTFIPKGRGEGVVFVQEIAPSPTPLFLPHDQREVYLELASLYSRQGVCR